MTLPRVLVIDDNPLNSRLAEFVLLRGGFDVRCAADATAGIDVLAAFAPDIVLMDIQLPGMDGLELTRRLRSDPRHGHIAIIAFTAYAVEGDDATMRAAGCDGYLSKPIDVATFADQVRALLHARPPPSP